MVKTRGVDYGVKPTPTVDRRRTRKAPLPLPYGQVRRSAGHSGTSNRTGRCRTRGGHTSLSGRKSPIPAGAPTFETSITAPQPLVSEAVVNTPPIVNTPSPTPPIIDPTPLLMTSASLPNLPVPLPGVTYQDMLRACENMVFPSAGDNFVHSASAEPENGVHSAPVESENGEETSDDDMLEEDDMEMDRAPETLGCNTSNMYAATASEGTCASNRLRRHARPLKQSSGSDRPIVTASLGVLEVKGHGKKSVSNWFLPEMRFEWTQCWPRWKNVCMSTKDRLWLAFNASFDVRVEEHAARKMWSKQCGRWYSSGMHKVKDEALRYFKTNNVLDLVGTAKPDEWMKTQTSWDSFVAYWNLEKTIKVSNNNKKSRLAPNAGVHGFGNVGLTTRMTKLEFSTGVMPSPFQILLDINLKKRKQSSTNEETVAGDGSESEVYNPKFAAAWEKYKVVFAAKYGEDEDPAAYSPDFALYDMIEEVVPGLKCGRRLGFGPLSQSSYFESRCDSTSDSQASMQILLEEEIEKRRTMELEMASMKAKVEEQDAQLAKIREHLHLSEAASSNCSVNIDSLPNLAIPPQ